MKRLLELVSELHEHALFIMDQLPDGTEFDETPDTVAPSEIDSVTLLNIAQLLVGLRRLRERTFQADDLFGDPAWDILLEIFVAQCTGKRLSVTSACVGAATPTTGLRWLRKLEKADFITRDQDERDKRRIYVRLTDRGLDLMRQTLGQWKIAVAR